MLQQIIDEVAFGYWEEKLYFVLQKKRGGEKQLWRESEDVRGGGGGAKSEVVTSTVRN